MHSPEKLSRCKYIELFLSSLRQFLANYSRLESLSLDYAGSYAIYNVKVLDFYVSNSPQWLERPLLMLPQHEETHWCYS